MNTWQADARGLDPKATFETHMMGHQIEGEQPGTALSTKRVIWHATMRIPPSSQYWEGFGVTEEEAITDAYRRWRDEGCWK